MNGTEPYSIEFSDDIERHLASLSARDRAIVLDAIEQQLTHEPLVPTRSRKRLRENPLASQELRVGDFRVFYNVDTDQHVVILVALGLKVHNILFIDGKTYSV